MAICDFLLRENHGIEFRPDAAAIAAAPTDIAALMDIVDDRTSDVRHYHAANERLNRMVDGACGLLEMSEDSRMDAAGWRKYLEEAADNG